MTRPTAPVATRLLTVKNVAEALQLAPEPCAA